MTRNTDTYCSDTRIQVPVAVPAPRNFPSGPNSRHLDSPPPHFQTFKPQTDETAVGMMKNNSRLDADTDIAC